MRLIVLISGSCARVEKKELQFTCMNISVALFFPPPLDKYLGTRLVVV